MVNFDAQDQIFPVLKIEWTDIFLLNESLTRNTWFHRPIPFNCLCYIFIYIILYQRRIKCSCPYCYSALSSKTRAVSEPLIDVEPYRNTISWDEIEESAAQDMSGLSSEYGKSSGNEKDGALWLAEQFEREGIPYEILEYAPNRANFVAKLDADSNLKRGNRCVITYDIVTFDESKWVEGIHPLSGHIDEDGYIWGRGALDMKALWKCGRCSYQAKQHSSSQRCLSLSCCG